MAFFALSDFRKALCISGIVRHLNRQVFEKYRLLGGKLWNMCVWENLI